MPLCIRGVYSGTGDEVMVNQTVPLMSAQMNLWDLIVEKAQHNEQQHGARATDVLRHLEQGERYPQQELTLLNFDTHWVLVIHPLQSRHGERVELKIGDGILELTEYDEQGRAIG